MLNLSKTFETIRKELDGRPVISRFAPSPTGFLHMGHVVSMLYVWGITKALKGQILMRLEDHDRGRCRSEFEEALALDMKWLGFAADGGWGVDSPKTNMALRDSFVQSKCDDRYNAAIAHLIDHNLVFGCSCTRKQIAANDEASGVSHDELLYPGTCRTKCLNLDEGVGWRIKLEDIPEDFIDGFMGPLRQNPAKQCGDMLAKDRNSQWTYQFAVVQDDMAQCITLVVRGQDLTSSTGRQIALRRMMGGGPPPVYAHHPLVFDQEGKKLSKRTMAESISSRRIKGESGESILNEAAALAGLVKRPATGYPDLTRFSMAELLEVFAAAAKKS